MDVLTDLRGRATVARRRVAGSKQCPGEADQLTLVALRTAESWSSSAARVSLMRGWSSWFVPWRGWPRDVTWRRERMGRQPAKCEGATRSSRQSRNLRWLRGPAFILTCGRSLRCCLSHRCLALPAFRAFSQPVRSGRFRRKGGRSRGKLPISVPDILSGVMTPVNPWKR